MAARRAKVTFGCDKRGEWRWNVQGGSRLTGDGGEGYASFRNVCRGFNALLDKLGATAELTFVRDDTGERWVGTRA